MKARRIDATEHQEQVAVIQWFHSFATTIGCDPRLLFAIPNAGGFRGGFKSNVIRVVTMKREGVRSGVPDLFLAIPCTWHHGLFVEMKTSKGTLKPAQIEYFDLLQSQHFQCSQCHGVDEAIKVITEYLRKAGRIKSATT